jgi:cAMP phosphodiesterase
VKVVLLPSSVSKDVAAQHQFMTSYVINDVLAIDAGSVGLYGTAREQGRIRNIFLSHSHFDHIGSLPVFVENAYEEGHECVNVFGSQDVLNCLRSDVFNDRVWPDFLRISETERPFLKLVPLGPNQTVKLDGLSITPVPVNHAVPTMAYVVKDASATVLIVSDTGPTDEIWEHANRAADLKAIFLPIAFPNELTNLANISKHLTPALVEKEVRKLRQSARILAVHLKSRFREILIRELQELGMPNLEIGQFDDAYHF